MLSGRTCKTPRSTFQDESAFNIRVPSVQSISVLINVNQNRRFSPSFPFFFSFQNKNSDSDFQILKTHPFQPRFALQSILTGRPQEEKEV